MALYARVYKGGSQLYEKTVSLEGHNKGPGATKATEETSKFSTDEQGDQCVLSPPEPLPPFFS